MSEITPQAATQGVDSYSIAYKCGLFFAGLDVAGAKPAAVEQQKEFEVLRNQLLDGRLRHLNPLQALEGFLIGLGTPDLEVDTASRSVEKEPDQPSLRQGHVEVSRRLFEAGAVAKRAVDQWVDTLEADTGRTYRHSILARCVADMLSNIFGPHRDPGLVLDEAIASRFDVTGEGIELDDMQRLAANARQRIAGSPDLMIKLVAPWIASAVAGGIPDASSTVIPLTGRLVRFIFLDDPVDDDSARIAMGMFLGGLLGAICLTPFRNRFATDRLVNSWSEHEVQQARDWVMQMVDPLSKVTALGMWGELRTLEPLRQIRWLPSTDFLMQLGILSKGAWYYEDEGEASGLQDWLVEQVRMGSMLAVWRSGGRYEVAPSEALGPNLVRHHNFNRGQDRSSRWDLSVSLNALTDLGHAAYGSFETTIPHPELVEDAIEDALAAQQWELAEALASLWVLHLSFDDTHRLSSARMPVEFLAWQRQTQPREYGYLGPTARYLLALSRTPEYANSYRKQDVEAICELFVGGNATPIEPHDLTQSAARAELVSRLVGPAFLQLPIAVKSKLVDAVLKRKLLVAQPQAATLRHFGGDTVALINPLESLLRERFGALSDECVSVLETFGFRFGGVKPDMTLGPMVNALKRYRDYPGYLQDELRGIFPCLPLSRPLREKLFSLNRIRNLGAHEDITLTEHDEAWNLLFSSSFKEAVENPGVYAILGRQFH